MAELLQNLKSDYDRVNRAINDIDEKRESLIAQLKNIEQQILLVKAIESDQTKRGQLRKILDDLDNLMTE